MAVVRLKRRCNENPVDSLLFASKRLKTDEEECDLDPTLFTFAATVASKEQDCSASACVNKVLQCENIAMDNTQTSGSNRKSISAKSKRISDITDKLRRENRLHSQNFRYEVVNLYRNIKPDDSNEEGTITPLTVIDIVNQDKTEQDDKEMDYVYDLFYTEMGADLDELIAGNTYSIVPIQDELYLGGDSKENSEAEEDEDSNEENNFRNDYPDEDEVKDDEDEYKSEEDYEGDIFDYEEDPAVSGMVQLANDFFGQCRLAASEDDTDSDDGELSSDEEDKIYDEDLVLSHSSYATYVKKKARREAYKDDIDDVDEYS